MRTIGWIMVTGFTCLTLWAGYHAWLELSWNYFFWVSLAAISFGCLGLTLRALGFVSAEEAAKEQPKAPDQAPPPVASPSADTVKDLR